jgi:T6SS, Phospholipase effector Tle1-like, catalytic domain
MAKNVVVYSDGTGQDAGVRPEQRVSNVYKIYRASRTGPDNTIDPNEQVAFYDPGLGTDIGATALSSPWRFIQRLLGSVTGRGIVRNIADCYGFIINHYEPGDRVPTAQVLGPAPASCSFKIPMTCSSVSRALRIVDLLQIGLNYHLEGIPGSRSGRANRQFSALSMKSNALPMPTSVTVTRGSAVADRRASDPS